jgi:hypothetical protein
MRFADPKYPEKPLAATEFPPPRGYRMYQAGVAVVWPKRCLLMPFDARESIKHCQTFAKEPRADVL